MEWVTKKWDSMALGGKSHLVGPRTNFVSKSNKTKIARAKVVFAWGAGGGPNDPEAARQARAAEHVARAARRARAAERVARAARQAREQQQQGQVWTCKQARRANIQRLLLSVWLVAFVSLLVRLPVLVKGDVAGNKASFIGGVPFWKGTQQGTAFSFLQFLQLLQQELASFGVAEQRKH